MSYSFLRWVRFGVAAALDENILEAGDGPRARITVAVNVEATGLASSFASLPIDVLGPADTGGIDHRQVIRTFPRPGTLDFEPTYLAHVEFDRPDLPWLFTPAAPAQDGTLRPWLCLAVIEKREGIDVVASSPLPKLKIAQDAGLELPALETAHLWTHVQIAGPITTPVDQIARDQPERILSRLLCPRTLEPEKSYFACLVPTYKVGADAGLGAEVPVEALLDDAWTAATGSIELPVYYHWEFSTGGSGDFKSLVTRLQARANLDNVGTRPLDVTAPGFGIEPRAVTTVVQLGGALRVTTPADPPINEPLAEDLAGALGEDGMTPPVYGRWHAAATVNAVSSGTPGWLEALNLDPRYRIAAGLGTKVVQDRQEDLMTAVWAQFGEIQKANQLLRHAQLAVAASERVVARHFAPLPDADLLALTGPAFGRMLVSPGRTVRRAVVESCAPLIGFSGAFRRVVRTRGPLGRRLTRLAHTDFSDLMYPPAARPTTLWEGLADGRWNLPKPALPDGAIPAPSTLIPAVTRRPRVPGRATVALDPGPGLDVARPLQELLPVFGRLARADRAASACAPLNVGSLASTVRTAITPDVAIPPRVRAQLAIPNDPRLFVSSRLDPVMAAPEIPTPMIGPLLDLGQDWLLPGLVNVPPNVVTVVEPDTAFIEAYMVGLNHEMGRELLWRGFPTDQRGTVFSKFWDRRGTVASPTAPIPEKDIPPIAAWDATDALGANMDRLSRAGIILLIRGDLLQRYPHPTIYLRRARWKRHPQTQAIVFDGNLAVREPVPLQNAPAWDSSVRFPMLTGHTGPDVMYLGFPIAKADVGGLNRTDLPPGTPDDQAGWFVVFEEHHTEPRFGFSSTSVESPDDFPPNTIESEAVAKLLLRPAFRLFVHASDLVS